MEKSLLEVSKRFLMLLSIAVFITSCVKEEVKYEIDLSHAQGEMSGEATQSSIILQSRLTSGNNFMQGDIAGAPGVACFELSERLNFENSFKTQWERAIPEYDFIIKQKVNDLQPGKRYYYRLLYGPDKSKVKAGNTCTFRTLDSSETEEVDDLIDQKEFIINITSIEKKKKECTFVVVTGMHYHFFHYGYFIWSGPPYEGPDKHLGPPALKTILSMHPDFFVGTGDNVYYDEPFEPAAQTQQELRKKYHEQFVQPRYVNLFARTPTYWEKDDHDYRFNDSDRYSDSDIHTRQYRKEKGDWGPSHELGVATFLEQLPVVDPKDLSPVTYRTHQINRLLQIWLVEGRDYRSPNNMPDGPNKTIWGKEQKEWLKRTLLASKATFKILISPTPMVGPDDRYKSDNHTNKTGFRFEADEFFSWLLEHGFLTKNFYIVCGDRHWQFHSIHPSGFEEFACGALVDANSRLGRKPGDPESTDPEAKITQPYLQKEASGGFLRVNVTASQSKKRPQIRFSFFDENGRLLYERVKTANNN